jgi:HAD superfamily hydrolase (TIGR01549 family)
LSDASDDRGRLAVFDFDGTLLDSDAALVAPFLALGVPPEEITFGHVFADECERLGIDTDQYLSHYDSELAQPFAGVDELVSVLDRWAICSNKHPDVGAAELARLGWKPTVALFADAFSGPKELGPVLERLGVAADLVVFVGDTEHDRACAEAVGAPFAFAGWNVRRAKIAADFDLLHPMELLAVLAQDLSRET